MADNRYFKCILAWLLFSLGVLSNTPEALATPAFYRNKSTKDAPVILRAKNWPLSSVKPTSSPFNRSLFKGLYKWADTKRTGMSLPDPYSDLAFRRLSLFSTKQNIIVPLVGSKGPEQEGSMGHPVHDMIPVNSEFIKSILQCSSILTTSKEWHFVLTDNKNNILQFLAPTQDKLPNWPGYKGDSKNKTGYLDLKDEALKAGKTIHGITSLQQKTPVVIRLTDEASGPDQRITISHDKLTFFKSLEEPVRDQLVLATAENSSATQQLEKILIPLNAIATHKSFVDTQKQHITVSTTWPPNQLTVEEATRSPTAPDNLTKALSAAPPKEGRRLDLVIGNSQNGHLHRIANFSFANSAEWTAKNGQLEIQITIKDLLLLYLQPQFRRQTLFIRERIEVQGEIKFKVQTYLYTLTREAFELSDIEDYIKNPLLLHTSQSLKTKYVRFFVNAHDLTPSRGTLLSTKTTEGPLALPNQSRRNGAPVTTDRVAENSTSTVIIQSTSQRARDAAMANATGQTPTDQALLAGIPTKQELLKGTRFTFEEKQEYSRTHWPDGKKKNAQDKGKKNKDSKPKMHINPNGLDGDKTGSMEQIRQRQTDKITNDVLRGLRDEILQQQRYNRGSGGGGGGGDEDGSGQPYGAGRMGEASFESPPTPLVMQSLYWLKGRIIGHPYHTIATLAAVKVGLDLYKYWSHLPGPRELLISKASASLPVTAPPFEYEALEKLVNGTPAALLSHWGPDTLANWVHQACENWCRRHACNAQHLPETFTHYVLPPVSAEKQKFLEEIRLRISEQHIESSSPWMQAVKIRRSGFPAAVDVEPVTNFSWLAELDDQGMLIRAHKQHKLMQKPVKIWRHSFLSTKNTEPMHKRFAKISNHVQFVDVTGQYRKITSYPLDNQRYGIYVCITIDGTNWRAIDFSGEEPGTYGVPAVIGYAHKAVDGWCLVSSMDKWLAIILENGEVDILHPIEPRYPVRLNLQQMLSAETDQLNSSQCTLEYWQDRQWHGLTLRDTKNSGEVEADLPGNAFFRTKCHKETTTFTLGHNFNTLELWSWPSTLNTRAFKLPETLKAEPDQILPSGIPQE